MLRSREEGEVRDMGRTDEESEDVEEGQRAMKAGDGMFLIRGPLVDTAPVSPPPATAASNAELRERLAAVEAERDAALAKLDRLGYSAADVELIANDLAKDALAVARRYRDGWQVNGRLQEWKRRHSNDWADPPFTPFTERESMLPSERAVLDLLQQEGER